jgi:hypothetical protein
MSTLARRWGMVLIFVASASGAVTSPRQSGGVTAPASGAVAGEAPAVGVAAPVPRSVAGQVVVRDPSAPASGNTRDAATGAAVLAATAGGDQQLVKVAISTSRSEVTNEGGYGIFADLQNLDAVPLTLRAVETMLVVQPELGDDHHRIIAVAGFYPTEEKFGNSDKQAVREIVLQPKEHYVAFWDITGRHHGDEPTVPRSMWEHLPSLSGGFTYVIDRLAFVPGNYAFVVVGKAYRNVNGAMETTYHTYTDQVKLHVGLTQIDAMLAAMLGGVLGYLVVGLREGGDFSKYTFLGGQTKPDGTSAGLFAAFKPWLIVGRSLISAALVSAVVTILLSRISDTQFPIKVSVADFWGALTVGFVAFFVGNKLIDRIVGFATKPGNGTGAVQVPPAGPAAPAPAAPAAVVHE